MLLRCLMIKPRLYLDDNRVRIFIVALYFDLSCRSFSRNLLCKNRINFWKNCDETVIVHIWNVVVVLVQFQFLQNVSWLNLISVRDSSAKFKQRFFIPRLTFPELYSRVWLIFSQLINPVSIEEGKLQVSPVSSF